MELAAAVQEQLPVIVLVWNNAGYGEIHAGMLAADVAPIGVEIDAPDFVAAARALGCLAQRVTTHEALEQTLVAAAREKVPTLIELPQESFCTRQAGSWYGR
jgi:acetolactate synthase-1/2/3 large subunit